MPEALAVHNTWYMSKDIVHNGQCDYIHMPWSKTSGQHCRTGRNHKQQNGFLTNISAYTIVLPLLMGRLVAKQWLASWLSVTTLPLMGSYHMTYVSRQRLLHTNNMKRMPNHQRWGIGIQCVCGRGGEYHVLHYGNMQGEETSASGRCTRTHAHTLYAHTTHPQMHKCTHAHTHGHTMHTETENQKDAHSI